MRCSCRGKAFDPSRLAFYDEDALAGLRPAMPIRSGTFAHGRRRSVKRGPYSVVDKTEVGPVAIRMTISTLRPIGGRTRQHHRASLIYFAMANVFPIPNSMARQRQIRPDPPAAPV